jgi:hypothetical protein
MTLPLAPHFVLCGPAKFAYPAPIRLEGEEQNI